MDNEEKIKLAITRQAFLDSIRKRHSKPIDPELMRIRRAMRKEAEERQKLQRKRRREGRIKYYSKQELLDRRDNILLQKTVERMSRKYNWCGEPKDYQEYVKERDDVIGWCMVQCLTCDTRKFQYLLDVMSDKVKCACHQKRSRIVLHKRFMYNVWVMRWTDNGDRDYPQHNLCNDILKVHEHRYSELKKIIDELEYLGPHFKIGEKVPK